MPGTKGGILGPKRVPRTLFRQDCTHGDKQQHSCCYIDKERGMRPGPLCALQSRLLTWCSRTQVTLKARHIPGQLNVVADKLSRLDLSVLVKKML